MRHGQVVMLWDTATTSTKGGRKSGLSSGRGPADPSPARWPQTTSALVINTIDSRRLNKTAKHE